MNIDEILLAVLSDNNTKIQEAESCLRQIAKSDYGNMLCALAEKISDENISIDKRQLSASIIRNSIREGDSSNWFKLNTKIKDLIKTNVLSSLASKHKEIRKSGSLAVAGIASVEIPKNLWKDIIYTLITTANHTNINFKISSVITIGYIAVEIAPNHFSVEEKNGMVNAIVTLIENDKNSEVLNCAIEAIMNLIPYSRSIQDNYVKFYLFSLKF